jgi:hypothetical protein
MSNELRLLQPPNFDHLIRAIEVAELRLVQERAFAQIAAIPLAQERAFAQIAEQLRTQEQVFAQVAELWRTQEATMQALGNMPLPIRIASAGLAAGHMNASGTATVTTAPKAEHQRIDLPPGVDLGRVLKTICPRKYGGIFYPLIADAQHEYIEAIARNKPTRWIRVYMWLLVVLNVVREVGEWLVRLRG